MGGPGTVRPIRRKGSYRLMSTAQEWQIRKRAHQCEQTGEPFQDGDVVVSRLVFEEEEGYRREDYSLGAWAKVDDGRSVSVWRSEYESPPPPDEKEPVQKETAEGLLRKLMETEDPENRNTIYILALMLERKRIFEEKDVRKQEDGGKIRVYEHKKTNETFLIPDPQLHLDEIESIQEEVVARLG